METTLMGYRGCRIWGIWGCYNAHPWASSHHVVALVVLRQALDPRSHASAAKETMSA